jgi:threonine/homoserine/homoserine lactone efflux protein
MNANFEVTKTRFSTLWLFLSLNYICCDMLGLMDSSVLKQYLAGSVDGNELTQGFLLVAAILLEIPFLMVLLSRTLKYRCNRWANIVAGTVMAAVQIATLFMGTSTVYYTFFSVIEIAAAAFVIWYAWQWRNAQNDLKVTETS